MGKGLKLCVALFFCFVLASCAAKRTNIHSQEKITADANYLQSADISSNVKELNYHILHRMIMTTSEDSVFWVIYDTNAQKDEKGNYPKLAEGGSVSKTKGETHEAEADTTIYEQEYTKKVETHAEVHKEKETDVTEKTTKVPYSEAFLIICVFFALFALACKLQS